MSIKNSLKFVTKDPIDSIGSDNGMAPNSLQAIIWTKDVLSCRRMHVSLVLKVLNDSILNDKKTKDELSL